MSIQLQNAVCRPSASTSCLSANSYRCTILARQPRCRLRARRQGPQTARRARLAIAAAAPENSGGWLSQWFQGLVQGTISRSDQPRKMAQEVPQRPESSDTAAARMPSSDAGKPGMRQQLLCVPAQDCNVEGLRASRNQKQSFAGLVCYDSAMRRVRSPRRLLGPPIHARYLL